MKLPVPLALRLLNRLGRSRDIDAVSHRSWEIAAGVSRSAPVALYDPASLSCISGVAEGSTLAQQIVRIEGTKVDHAPTRAHLFKDARVCGGHLLLPACLHRVGSQAVPWFCDSGATRIDSAALGSTAFGVRYFGHWLLDDIPLQLVSRSQTSGGVFDVMSELSDHQKGYLRLLDLAPRTWLNARIGELVVVDDHGQNDHKAGRLEWIRQRLLAAVPSDSDQPVMILRKDTGKSRHLTNEMELAARLEAQGFRILSPMESSAEDIVRATTRARIVVGVEGSHLTHAILCMPPGSTLITIQPPNRFDAVLKDWCDVKGVRYGFVVGSAVPEGFSVSLGDVDRMIQSVP